jgi:hypothetical protein
VGIDSEENQALELIDQVADLGLRQVHGFRGDEVAITPAHQAFIVIQNEYATLLSRPLLLNPARILA